MKTRSLLPRAALVGLLLSSVAPVLPARIISYSPVTNRHATPAVQNRQNRHYVLVESAFSISFGYAYDAKLVLYDSKGESEPRVVFPKNDSPATILAAACREEAGQPMRILVVSDANIGDENPFRANRFFYSADAGDTWKTVALPEGSWLASDYLLRPDIGGPIVRERGSQLRIGSRDTPFVVALNGSFGTTIGIYAIGSNGASRLLLDTSASNQVSARLIGSDREGKQFLVRGKFLDPASSTPDAVRIVDVDRGPIRIFPFSEPAYTVEGWITPAGAVYLEDLGKSLWVSQGGKVTLVAVTDRPNDPVPPNYFPFSLDLFAVPTFDFSGAWVLRRSNGPTILSRHAPGSALVEQWRDISGPEVEALHAGASGEKLLVQVHVARAQADQRIFRDPALAVWTVGQPAPQRYDELFLVEGFQKGFVHLDVEAVAAGEPFVFDSSAAVLTYAVAPSAGGGGGGDVTQEWGVVRASLKQKLVIPAVGRLPGAFGSFWRTDLIVRNPTSDRMTVLARFVPSSTGTSSAAEPVERRIELGPNEIWLYPDVLGAIFDVARGSGALFLTPEGDAAVTATSRTYTDSPKGTYGMGVGAMDLFAAVGARFPVSFAGALQGSDFRTNVVAVDTSGRGAEISLRAVERGREDFSFHTPAGGQAQLNSLGALLEVSTEESGALQVEPLSGQVIASVIAVDNRTNDPTWFLPDLPSPFVRTIPVIGHVDGAGGSRFRSDLFLFNPSDQSKSIILTAKRWDVSENESAVTLTLRPRESRAVRDVLPTLFGKTGIARLRFLSGNDSFDATGIRVTSRLYTLDPSGGTFGLLVPPLNSFQSAGVGESLEILGPQGGKNFRTNLSLVELTAFPEGPPARVGIEIFDDLGKSIDAFEASVPIAGGIQLLDVFRARGLGDGPPAALIRVSPHGGLVGAFATTLDNGTNDPTYFGAVLASRE